MSYRTSLKSIVMVILLISMMALGGVAQATPVVSADYATEAEAVSLDYAVSSTAGELDAAYHIGAGFEASNPEQGYDLTFGAEGVTLEANGLALTYALSGFGYGDSLTYSAAERTLAGVNRVEYGRGTVTEWYVNGPEGVQQGYTFAQRPAVSANGWLTVAIAVNGDYTPVLRGSAVELVGKDGSVLTYGGLLAYDATGKLLPVALEVDGNTILLRANDVAAVYPVTIDPIVQQQKLNPGVVAASGTSGRVVAIDGDYAVVGARAISGGRVFVYQRSGATWTLVQTLQTLSGGANPQFGDAVAISLPYLAVGAITADSADGAGTGEAYIYQLVGGSFVLLQSITADTTMPAASNGDFLGSAVAFSPNGSLLLVGAPLDDRDIDGLAGDEADAGSAYMFELAGGLFTFGNIHDASNYSGFIGGRAFTASDNFFGAVLDVADDGTVIIGAISYDGLTPAVPENGLAFAAQYDTATNTFTVSGPSNVLSAGVGGGIRYGSDVDLSTTSAIVGSETGNRARIYDRAGASMTLNTTLTGAGNFGAAVEIDENRALVGAPTSGGIGAVFHYLPGSPWTAAPAAQTTNFTSTSAASGDQFGAAIAMGGAFVLVGAPFDDTGSVDAGSAYIFSIPEITVSDVTVTEGNSVVFTFTRNDGGGAPITINYTFNGGTTEAGDRGTATPASGFLCSTATCTVTITTVDDAIYDDPAPAETLSLTNITATVGALLNPVPVNGSTAAATVTGTINDNEGVPVLSIISPAAQPENVTPQIFVAQLSHARETGTVTFNCRTLAATASNIDGDYTPFGPGLCSVNIPAGDTNVDLPVALLDDLVNEPDEFYTVAISSPTNATLGNTLGIGYIEDDDPTPSVSVSCPATVQEGDAGTQAVVCTITLSGANSYASSLTVSVNPVLTEADATDIVQVTNQTVNFPAGTTSVQFIAQVVGDTLVEDDEDFTVTLDNFVGVVAGTTSTTVTIVNDDTAVATILVDNATILEAGGAATYTVSLSKPAENGFTVSLGYSGTATNGVDATPFAPVSVSCLANVTVCDTVTLTAVDDTVFEGPETATLTILAGAGYTVGLPSAATTTIIDNDGAPGIRLDSCTLGDEAGPTHITCTVSILTIAEADASASFVVIPGTASTPQDYSTSSGLVTIPAGSTSATFTIPVVDDTWFEGGLGTFETMTVILTNPVNATASSDMSEQASIQDNEDQPEFVLVYDESILGGISADPISEPEGTLLTGVCVDMITGNTAIPLEIGYFLYNGTALAGEDYQYVQDSFIIAAGTDAADSPCDQNIPIDTIDDLLWEGGPTTYETLFIELFEVDPALSFLGSALTINIEDNELVPPTLRILDAQVVEGNAGTTNLAFVVQLVDALGNPAPAGVDVTFDYISAAGTATNGADYSDVSGTATIVKGQTSATVLVPVLGDLIDEENETLTLTGSNPTPTGVTFSDATAIGTIIDDDNAPALSVSVAPASDVEGDADNTRTVTVSVPADSTSQVINFNYTFVGAGTTQAVVGLAGGCPAGTVDVIQNSGSGSITPVIGVSASFSTTFTVTVCGDNRVDADTETAGVRLSGVTNVNPNTSVFAADFDIIDDDTGTAVLTGPATIAENAGVATYTVTLQDDLAATMVAGTDVTVTYSVTAGTATAAVDYIAGVTGSVVIPAGSSSATFTVLIVNDAIDEIDETYTVALTGASGNFTAGDITATGSVLTTITDDDAAPVISIDDVTIVEGTGGATTAVFTISQSTVSSLATSVTVNTTAGTATSPADFTAIVGGTASIPAGQLSTTVSVNIVTDSLDEVNEVFTVDLTAPVNATLGDASGLGTIIDDDDAPLLSIADELVIEGNAGSVNVTFDLSLSAASDQAIPFSYYFVNNGTATQGIDYAPGACVAASVCTSVFPANSLTHTVTVNNLVLGDVVFEADETFGIVILPDNLGQISAFSDLNGVVTIQDDDTAAGLIIDVNDASVTEGNSVQTLITLNQVLGQDLTVTYRFDDATAVTPGDYQDQNNVSVVIPAGSTSVAITIFTNQDTLFEVAETFNIVLTTAIAADTTDLSGSIFGTPGVVTINDDGDAQPVVTIGDLALNEGNPTGLTTFNFPVTLNTASGVPVIVNWTRNVGVGVSAAEASDFDAVAPGCGSTTGSVTIPAGQLSAIVPICVIQDAVYEPDENFWLSYTVTNGSATPADVGLGTILNDDLPPTITINSVTVTEGNIATLTITRTGPTEVNVTGTFATADVTATAGLDYSSTSGSFTIAASLAPTATTTVTVTTLQDLIDEPSETLNVVLSNLTGSSTTSATGVVTIDDDDAAPTISISNAGATEGQLLTFTVTLSNPSASTVTVDYATNPGTASVTDYVGVSGTLTFLPGELSKVLTVESVQDTIFELAETFTVDLTNPVNATIAVAQGIGTITDNDAAPMVFSAADFSVTEGNAGTTTATITVTLSNPSYETIDLTAALSDALATITGAATCTGFPVDYTTTLTALPISFAPGVTTATVTFDVCGDVIDEADEDVLFTINGTPVAGTITSAGSDLTTVVTIVDNDATPTVQITDVTDDEANGPFQFLVTLVDPVTNAPVAFTGRQIVLGYTIAEGTAIEPEDYTGITGSLVIAQGVDLGLTPQFITVPVIDEALYEADETFTVTITSAVNAVLTDNNGVNAADPLAVGTIVNDDLAPAVGILYAGPDNLGAPTPEAFPDGLIYNIVLTSPAGVDIEVGYYTGDVADTATEGLDYGSIDDRIVIPAGSTFYTIYIPVINDTLYEGPVNETVTVFVYDTDNSPFVINDGDTGEIIDDDTPPSITINDVTVVETAGGVNAVFTVTQSALSGLPTGFTYALSDITATGGPATALGVDYINVGGTGTIPAGYLTTTISIPVEDDAIYELTETYNVTLSAPVNGTLGADVVGLGTIVNNTPMPTVDIGGTTLVEGTAGNVTITRNGLSQVPIVVNVATGDLTAIAPGDYVPSAGTGTIPASLNATENISYPVATNDDTIDEPNEVFTVTLNSASNAVINASPGVVVITDNDAAPTISIDDVTAVEGQLLTFTLTLSNPSASTVTVDYALNDGTAVAGDYVDAAGTLTFDPGVTSITLTVESVEDLMYELTETFTVDLTNPVNSTIADAQGVGTITDNDAPPVVTSEADFNVTEGNAGTTTVTIDVTLSNPSYESITLTTALTDALATITGAATCTGFPVDYVNVTVPAAVTFAPGSTTASVTFDVCGDIIDEDNELVTFTMTPSVGVIAGVGNDFTTDVTIVDDDETPTVQIVDVTAPESTTPFAFQVILVDPVTNTPVAFTGRQVTFGYTITEGSAIEPEDYTGIGGSLIIPADLDLGANPQFINVPVIDDTVYEATETFTVTLTSAINAVLTDNNGANAADPLAIGTITDNDATPTVTVTYFGPDSLGAPTLENNIFGLHYRITLSAAAGVDIPVNYYTYIGGTATEGLDYVGVDDTFIFVAGQTVFDVYVPVIDDLLFEGGVGTFESVVLQIQDTVNSPFAFLSSATGQIEDNELAPTISIDDVTVIEVPGGVNAVFTVTQSALSGLNTGFTYTLTDVTAVGGPAVALGVDYNNTGGTGTIAAGFLTTTITVPVFDDVIYELAETYNVTLSAPVNATLSADVVGVGTITDDDLQPTISISDVVVLEGGTAVLTITRTGMTQIAVSGTYSTSDVSAIAGLDYTAETTNFTIPASLNMVETVTVPAVLDVVTLNDLIDELDETFNVVLTNIIGATVADDTGVVTITDNNGVPNISIADSSAIEGQLMTFTLTLDIPSTQPITVVYNLNDGTAVGADYVDATGTITFAPNQTSVTVTVETIEDLMYELPETFTVDLSAPSANAAILDGQAVGTIIDNDAPPVVTSEADFNVTEGNAGTTTVTIDVTLSNPSYETITLTTALTDALATITGAATCTGFPVDYVNVTVPAAVTFAPGSTTASVTFDICGDVIDEDNELVTFTMTPSVGVIAGGGNDFTTDVTIVDDDETPTVQIADVTASEAVTPFAFSVVLIDPVTNAAVPFTGRQITFGYTIAEGSAIEPEDYTGLGGSLIIPADLDLGANPQFINVPVIDDTVYEATETFTVTLTSAINAVLTDNNGVNAADPLAIGTILDNDAAPTVTVTYLGPDNLGAPTLESNPFGLHYQITLSAAAGVDIPVNYYTIGGTASEGLDYIGVDDTIVLVAGQTVFDVYVPVIDDLLFEGGFGTFETVVLQIEATVNSPFLFLDQDTGQIEDNDVAPTITINDVTVVETAGGINAVFTVTQSALSGLPTGFTYALTDITATGGPATALGVDYINTGGTGTIAAGFLTTTIIVPVEDDAIYELTETYNVTLSAPVNATLGADVVGLGTIINSTPMPTVSIFGVTITEGGTGIVAITRNGMSQVPTIVNVVSSDITAISGVDYAPVAFTGTITPSLNMVETVGFTVSALEDLIDEPQESFNVAINSATNATVLTSPAIVLIDDNDAAPTISISDATAVEGQLLTFTLTLSNPSAFTVTVDYALNDGTAVVGDYVDAAGTLTFDPGVTSITLTVESVEDLIYELAETFTVDLTNPINSTIADAQGVGTITNNDAAPQVFSAADFEVIEGNAGSFSATVTVTLSNPSYETIELGAALAPLSPTLGGAATCTGFPVDVVFVPTPTTLTFAPGVTTATATIDICGDIIDEDNEDVLFNVVPVTGAITVAGSDFNTVVTIVDDDTLPLAVIDDVTQVEETSPFVFTVTLLDPQTGTPLPFTGRDVTIGYTIAEGTALEPEDYIGTGGTIVIPANTNLAAPINISIPVINDLFFEADETFTITLDNVTNATLVDSFGANSGDPVGLGTIVNTDTAPSVSVTYIGPNGLGAPTPESDVNGLAYTITLNVAAGLPIEIAYISGAVTDTATAGADYTDLSDVVVFQPGVTSVTVYVPVINDLLYEGPVNETVTLSIAPTANTPAGVTTGLPAVGEILDDDAMPSLTINDVQIIEGDAGSVNAVLTVTQSAYSGLPTSFQIDTVDVTATAGADYNAIVAGAGTIPAGYLTTTISVPVLGDLVYEGPETFNVVLTAPVNATIADDTGVVTIIDNDNVPRITITANPDPVLEANGNQTVIYTISLSNPSAFPVTFDWATADGTASSTHDYASNSGSLFVSPGVTAMIGFITVDVFDDALFDLPTENYLLNLTNIVGADIPNSETSESVDIIDNDPAPFLNFVAGAVAAVEGTNLVFTAQLTSDAAGTTPTAVGTDIVFVMNSSDGVTVPVARLSQPDYTDVDGTLYTIVGDGAMTSIPVIIPAIDDLLPEYTENVTAFLSLPTGSLISLGSAAVREGQIIDTPDPDPTVSIEDATVTEGAALDFVVSLSYESGKDVTVDVVIADVTTSPTDYTVPGVLTITIPAGSTTALFSVPTVQDLIYEADETLTVTLVNPVNATILDGVATGTIVNDDVPPTITIDSISIVEGDAGTTTGTLTVTLSQPAGVPVTLGYATSDGTATLADNDYVQIADQTLTIPAGVTTATITVTVNGDFNYEIDETFNVVLSIPVNGTLGAPSVGVVTIINDDIQPQVAITGPAVGSLEGTTDDTYRTFTFTLSAESFETVTANYQTVDGTIVDFQALTSDNDYEGQISSVVFAPGETVKTIQVRVYADNKYENDETYSVELVSVVNGTIDLDFADAEDIIINDDQVPTVTMMSDLTVIEDVPTVYVTATLSNPSGFTTILDVVFVDGPAVPPSLFAANNPADYVPGAATITFNPGETVIGVTNNGLASAFVTSGVPAPVAIVNDALDEYNETFTAILDGSNAGSGPVNPGTDLDAVITIIDDDRTPKLQVSDVSVPEAAGVATVTFSLVNPDTNAPVATGRDVVIRFSLADGTAFVVDDYLNEVDIANPVAVNQTCTSATLCTAIIPGDGVATSTSIDITIVDDTIYENPDQFFYVNVEDATNVDTLTSDQQGIVTIIDNDVAPTLDIQAAVSVNEGDSGVTPMTFNITLSAVAEAEISFVFRTMDGDILTPLAPEARVNDADYVEIQPMVVTIPPLAAGTTVTVQVLGDLTYELDEYLTAEIFGAVNATIGNNYGIGEIVNDDLAPVINIVDSTVFEGDAGTSPIVFTVNLTHPVTGSVIEAGVDVTFTVDTADGTATLADVIDGVPSPDYVAVVAGGPYTIVEGQSSTNITLNVNGDTKFESDEIFTVTVTPDTNATAGDVTAEGTIINDDAPPVISINDVSVVETNAGTVDVSFILTLSNAAQFAYPMPYRTFDGVTPPAATVADNDYNAQNSIYTLPQDVTSATFTVVGLVNGDTKFELDDQFTFEMLDVFGTGQPQFSKNVSVVTILNDDTPPVVTVNTALVVSTPEGNGPTMNQLVYTAVLSNATYQTLVVPFDTSDGTATIADLDYQQVVDGAITFAENALTQTFAVNVVGDNKYELDETVNVTLDALGTGTAGTYTVGAPSTHFGTIINDDAAPTVTLADLTGTEGTPMLITATLSNPSYETITVTLNTVSGGANPATAGADYTEAVAVTLTFPASTGMTNNLVSSAHDAAPVADGLYELPENFLGTITAGTGTVSSVQATNATFTIISNDPIPTLEIDDVSDLEGDTGTTPFVFTVTQSAISGETTTFQVFTADGTAKATAADYAAIVGTTYTIPEGSTTVTVTVNVNGDVKIEEDETFFVNLSNLVHAVAATDGIGDGTILNDDAAIPIIPGGSSFGFESGLGTWKKFTPTNTNTDDRRRCGGSVEGNCYFRFKGLPDEDSRLITTIPANQIPVGFGTGLYSTDDALRIALYYRTGAAQPRISVKIRVFFNDGTPDLFFGILGQGPSETFGPTGGYDPEDWREISTTSLRNYDLSDPELEGLPSTAIRRIRILIRHETNSAKIDIDDIRLDILPSEALPRGGTEGNFSNNTRNGAILTLPESPDGFRGGN